MKQIFFTNHQIKDDNFFFFFKRSYPRETIGKVQQVQVAELQEQLTHVRIASRELTDLILYSFAMYSPLTD